MGYVVIAVLSKYFLQEHISEWRWAGILLISCGVGWVTRGPALTKRESPKAIIPEALISENQEQHEIA